MDVRAVIALLRARAVLASRDRWTREELLVHQSHALAELRAFALARSPFYREFHRGLEAAPLESLPVLTKATLMERFDELVTDRDVRLGEVERHLASTGSTDLFRGRYRVAATSGTTGRRGVFLADRSEWTSVLASCERSVANRPCPVLRDTVDGRLIRSQAIEGPSPTSALSENLLHRRQHNWYPLRGSP